MWVIKVYFGNGTWYRGICERECYYKSTAKKKLLRDFKDNYTPAEIKARGNAKYEVYYYRGAV